MGSSFISNSWSGVSSWASNSTGAATVAGSSTTCDVVVVVVVAPAASSTLVKSVIQFDDVLELAHVERRLFDDSLFFNGPRTLLFRLGGGLRRELGR